MKNEIEDLYEIIVPLGSGSYGQVYKARSRSTGQIVALKKIKYVQYEEGFPKEALREICSLQSLADDNENIISLIDVITTNLKKNVYLVFDYFELDLLGLLSSLSNPFPVPQVKCYMIQLMKALQKVHSHGMIHRDLKPGNILISADNILKLGDFGLSRSKDSDRPLTNRVMTQRYRAPELSLGATYYGEEIDVWSLGCTFYEMMTGKPLFKDEMDASHLELIFKLFGVPSEKDWPEWRSLPNAQVFQFMKPSKSNIDEFLENNLPTEFHDAISILKRMLTVSPSQRITVDQALEDPYFYSPNNEYSPSNITELSIRETHSQTHFESKFFKKMKKEGLCHNNLYQELRPPSILPIPIFAD